MQFGYPQQRMERLYEDFPLLRWRGAKQWDIRKTSLGHKIFHIAFVDGQYNGILQRFEHDFARKLQPLLKRVEEFRNDVEVVKIKTAKNKELILNHDQIKLLRALQLYFIFDFHSDIAGYVADVSDDTLREVAKQVDRAFVDWAGTQKIVRGKACSAPDYEIEEYRAILWALLNNYDKDDSLNLLAAFCHQSWSRTHVRMLESSTHALYGLMFVAGILFKKIRPFAVPLSSVIAAFSFSLRTARGVRSLRTERALLLIDTREENNRIYANIFNAIAVPVSFFGLYYGAKSIVNVGGWRFFIPFRGWKNNMINLDIGAGLIAGRASDVKSHIDHNLNPMTTKNFWLNSLDNGLGSLLKGHALSGSESLPGRFKSTGLLSLTYALFNIYVQNLYFLFAKDEVTIENHKFNNMWGMFHSAPRNVVDWSIFWRISNKLNGMVASPDKNIGRGVYFASKFFDGWQKKTWYASSKLDYLKEDKNFLNRSSISMSRSINSGRYLLLLSKKWSSPRWLK